MNTEPNLTSSGIVAAISAVIAVLIAFGVVRWSPEQRDLVMAAIVAVLGVIAPLAAAWWSRGRVTPLVRPQVELANGRTVALVRADNQMPTPQAIESGSTSGIPSVPGRQP